MGLIPLKSNGHGGSKVIVVAVLLRTLNTPPMFLFVSGNPPKLCAHVGVAGEILKSMSGAKSNVSETVITLLPFVAPAVMAGPVEGGGHGINPLLYIGLSISGNAQDRLPLPSTPESEITFRSRIDPRGDQERSRWHVNDLACGTGSNRDIDYRSGVHVPCRVSPQISHDIFPDRGARGNPSGHANVALPRRGAVWRDDVAPRRV